MRGLLLLLGTFRTCRDFRVESAFGGKTEVGFEPAKGSFWRNAVIPAQALRFELAVEPGQVLIAVKIRCVGCHVCLQ